LILIYVHSRKNYVFYIVNLKLSAHIIKKDHIIFLIFCETASVVICCFTNFIFSFCTPIFNLILQAFHTLNIYNFRIKIGYCKHLHPQ